MKLEYYKEDDILVITLSDKFYDHAEMKNNFVVHYTKKKEPVRIEVLDASKVLKNKLVSPKKSTEKIAISV